MKKFVAKTKNGFDVYVDTEASHAATHLKGYPALFALMQEVLLNYVMASGVDRFETDFGRVIGSSSLVMTAEGDDVFYAKRPNREKYTRFVRGKEAFPTNFITTDLRKRSDTECFVYTVFAGKITPPFPRGKDDTNSEARDFWNMHALIADAQEYIKETVITECPW